MQDSSFPSQLAFRFEYGPLDCQVRLSARMERNDFGVLSTSRLISFCSQLQFRSNASSASRGSRYTH
jgi:hypothetical protein